MTNVIFNKIYGKNFNSFGEFELSISSGKHLIIGENLNTGTGNSNGSGKSSLLESMIWSLFKKYSRGKDPSRNGHGNCMCGVSFNIGNDEYVVERYYKDTKNKNSVSIKIFK